MNLPYIPLEIIREIIRATPMGPFNAFMRVSREYRAFCESIIEWKISGWTITTTDISGDIERKLPNGKLLYKKSGPRQTWYKKGVEYATSHGIVEWQMETVEYKSSQDGCYYRVRQRNGYYRLIGWGGRGYFIDERGHKIKDQSLEKLIFSGKLNEDYIYQRAKRSDAINLYFYKELFDCVFEHARRGPDCKGHPLFIRVHKIGKPDTDVYKINSMPEDVWIRLKDNLLPKFYQLIEDMVPICCSGERCC